VNPIPATQTLTGRVPGGIQNMQPMPAAVQAPSIPTLDDIAMSQAGYRFGDKRMTDAGRAGVRAIQDGIRQKIEAARQGAQDTAPGLLAAPQQPQALPPQRGLLVNPPDVTPPVPDPNAALRARLQKGGTPDSVQNAINKVNAVSDYLRSDKFQQWDAKPDLKNISKADLQRVYDQAYQHAVENKNPTRPAKGYKNPDPAGGTWQEILKMAGII
jgi:hypothetical protein